MRKILLIISFVFTQMSLFSQVTESDSLALLDFYQSTGGQNWTVTAGWGAPGVFVGDWNGIEIENGRVVGIRLPGNNLTGQLPVDIGNLDAVEVFDVSDNLLSGELPESLFWLPLTTLNISDNPSFTGRLPRFVTDLFNLELFDFTGTDICELPNQFYLDWKNTPGRTVLPTPVTCLNDEAFLSDFSVAGEVRTARIDPRFGTLTVYFTETADITNLIATFSLPAGANAYIVGDEVPQISGVSANDFTESLTYRVIAEDGVTETEYTIVVELTPELIGGVIASDFYALAEFKIGTEFPWTNQENWPTSGPGFNYLWQNDVETWYGVTVTNNRVTALDLSNNNILLRFGWSEVLKRLTAIEAIDLSNNPAVWLDDLTSLPNLQTLNISNCMMASGAILNNLSLFNDPSEYLPQQVVDFAWDRELIAGEDFSVDLIDDFGTSIRFSAQDELQWYFDNTPIPGATTTTLSIPNFQAVNIGEYKLIVTNPALQGYELVIILGTLSLPNVSTGNSFEAFEVGGQLGLTTIDDLNATINLILPCDFNPLITPYFALSNGATARINDAEIISNQTTLDFSNDLSIEVTAQSGEVRVWTITVSEPDQIESVDMFITPNTRCVNPDGSIMIIELQLAGNTITDFTGFSFSWSSDNFQTSLSGNQNFENLEGGNYQLRITDNATQCVYETEFEVTDNIGELSVGGEAVGDFGCNGIQTGAFGFEGTVNGIRVDISDWSFDWYEGTGANKTFILSSNFIGGLAAGEYTLIATYIPTGCSLENEYTVERMDFEGELDATIVNNTDCISSNGQVTINSVVIDGQQFPPTSNRVAIQWSNGATGGSIVNLDGDEYSVVVTDVLSGCEYAATYSVQTQNLGGTLQVANNTPNTRCESPNGSLSVNVDGDTDGYTFEWYTGTTAVGQPFATGPTISGRVGGTYTVKATETGTSCSSTLTQNIANNPTQLEVTLQATENTKCTDPNGAIEIASFRVNGATRTNFTGYAIEWSQNAAFTSILSREESLSGLAPGRYYVRVRETATGCVSPAASALVQENLISPEFEIETVNNSSCTEVGNGTASLTGIEDNWLVAWYRGEEVAGDITGPSADNLLPGSYKVEVTNPETNCSAARQFVIEQEVNTITVATSNTPVTLCSSQNGTANVTGITVNNENVQDFEAFSFEWSTSLNFDEIISQSSELTEQSAGDYYIRVTLNSTGCQSDAVKVTILEQIPEIQISLVEKTDNLRGNTGTGSLEISTNPEVNVIWYAGENAGSDPVGEGVILENLVDGNYLAIATDPETGCFNEAIFTVDLSPFEIQSIEFSLPESIFQDELPFTLEAVSDKNVPIEFEIISGAAIIENGVITSAEPGNIIVRAFNQGSETAAPASSEADMLIMGNYTISGTITGIENPAAFSGTIRAYQNETEVAMANIDNGAFSLPSLREGEYILYVSPSGESRSAAFDTYFGESLFSSQAEPFLLNTDTDIEFTVLPKPVDNVLPTGTGTIRGQVSESNEGSRIVIGRLLDGTPLEGVTVFLLAENSTLIVRSTTTDAIGQFTFENIPSGNYTIKLDNPGLSVGQLEAAFTFDEEAGVLEIAVLVGDEDLTVEYSIIASVEDKNNQFTIYPNPASSYFKIQSENSNNCCVRIYTLAGILIKNYAISTSNTYNIEELESGVYVVAIEDNAGRVQHKKLLVSK